MIERKWIRCHQHGRVLGGRSQFNAYADLLLILLTFGLWLPISLWSMSRPFRCPICNKTPGYHLPIVGNIIILVFIVLAALAGAFK